MAEKQADQQVTVEDEELDELLDSALGDFGRHVPKDPPPPSNSSSNNVPSDVGFDQMCQQLFSGSGISPKDLEEAKQLMSDLIPEDGSEGEGGVPEGLEAFEKIFTTEFAKEAESRMKEAFESISNDNPQLLQELEKASKDFETFTQQQQQQQQQEKKEPAKSEKQEVDNHKDGKVPESNGAHSSNSGASQTNGSQTSSSNVSSASSKEQHGETEKDALPQETKDREGKDEKRSEHPSIEETMAETLRKMQENVQNAGKMDDFLGLPGGMNFGGEGSETGLLSMMENMMGTLLSKEVLHPPLKEFCSKYPDWLKAHREELSDADHTRYGSQLDIMRRVCREFDGESEGDPAPLRQERLDRVMQLMHQLQGLGQPPEDLIKESPGMNFLP